MAADKSCGGSLDEITDEHCNLKVKRAVFHNKN